MIKKNSSNFSDEELVILLKKNDERVLEEIYKRYREKLFHLGLYGNSYNQTKLLKNKAYGLTFLRVFGG